MLFYSILCDLVEFAWTIDRRVCSREFYFLLDFHAKNIFSVFGLNTTRQLNTNLFSYSYVLKACCFITHCVFLSDTLIESVNTQKKIVEKVLILVVLKSWHANCIDK